MARQCHDDGTFMSSDPAQTQRFTGMNDIAAEAA
jgi:hypothetical protein